MGNSQAETHAEHARDDEGQHAEATDGEKDGIELGRTSRPLLSLG